MREPKNLAQLVDGETRHLHDREYGCAMADRLRRGFLNRIRHGADDREGHGAKNIRNLVVLHDLIHMYAAYIRQGSKGIHWGAGEDHD